MSGPREVLWFLIAAISSASTFAATDPGELGKSESILKSGTSFEEGINLDTWNHSGNKAVATLEQARSGATAVKSHVHRTESGTNYRTELSLKGQNLKGEFGKVHWYGFSIFLPSPYAVDNLDELLAQWHATADSGEDDQNPPLALGITEGQWMIVTRWNSIQPTLKSNQTDLQVIVGGHAVDRWTDWVFRVKWSYGSDGSIQAWKDGVKVLDRTGPNTYRDEKGPYFKMGIYKAFWRNNEYKSLITSRTVFHDEFRMAGADATYDDVAPGKNGSSKTPAAPTLVAIE